MRFALLLAALLLALPAQAATYWVSPTGNAGNSGADSTTNAKTLAWANANAAGGDLIRFKSGAYGDPIWPVNSGTSGAGNDIRFIGFPQDRGGVTVVSIHLGSGRPDSASTDADRANYVTIKHVSTSKYTVHGPLAYDQGGGSYHTAIGDTVRNCAISGGFGLGATSGVFDSLAITFAENSGDYEMLNGFTAGELSATAGSNRFWNNTVTGSISSGAGQGHVLAFKEMYNNWFYGNTYNITFNAASGYFSTGQLYQSDFNLFQNDVWNVTMNGTPGGTKVGWSHRDGSRGNRYLNCQFLYSGAGQIDNLLTNSGTSSLAWANTYWGCTFKIETPFSGVMNFQDGMIADSVVFCQVISGSTAPALLVNVVTGIDSALVRHNTFWTAGATAVSATAPEDSGRASIWASNIFYGATANANDTELLRINAGADIDSAGCFFAPGGNATVAIDDNGTNRTPGGTQVTNCRWGTPAFTDSVYAGGLNLTPGESAYAVNAIWSGGYAGAIAAGAGEPLAITTTTLPGGTVGSAYSQTVSATGGTAPYTWTISAGALPDGLSIAAATGIISGTPAVANTFNFTVQVEDDVAATDTQALSIVVAAAATSGRAWPFGRCRKVRCS